MRVDSAEACQWCVHEAADQNWNTRAQERQIGSLCYERLLLSQDKVAVAFEAPEHRYARCFEMAEIEKNDFNLNLSRYISTALGEAWIDLAAAHAELVRIE